MKDKNNIITLSTVFILFSIFFWAKTGNMMIDFSREIYIPYQMQTGQVLVKDIFLIYGAFGYIANLIIYKFLTNINLLLLEAHIISYSIIILVYFILNKFFTKKASIFLSMLFMGVSVFSNSTFSFVLPYSYSNLWAVFGIYLSLFGILYNRKNILFLALGLILANRIEYFIPAFLISICYLVCQKESFKKNIIYMFICPLVPILYFLANKVNLNNFIYNYHYIKEMFNTDALKHLYRGMGVFFEKKYFVFNCFLSIKIFLIFAISYLLYFIKKLP